MKFQFTEITYTVLILFCLSLLAKFILWVQLNPKRRVGIIKSFIIWFSVHDVHNAGSVQSKNFRRYNNLINVLFWTCIILFAVIYIYDTGGEVLDTAPKTRPTSK